jgi:hypothetical protein
VTKRIEGVTKENGIHEEIKSKLNSGNACCHSIHNVLSPHLLSKNVNIKIELKV